MKNDYLIHYGTKGQKWGIRKYQNEDGTLTPAGRERYLKEGAAYKKGNYGNDYQRQRAYDATKQIDLSSRKDDLAGVAKGIGMAVGHDILTSHTDRQGLDVYAHNRAAGRGVLRSSVKAIGGTLVRDIGKSAIVGIGGATVGGILKLGGLDVRPANVAAYASLGYVAVTDIVRGVRSVRNAVQGSLEYKRNKRNKR